jgi:cold shock CspA family protein
MSERYEPLRLRGRIGDRVKWLNTTKGRGFIAPDGDSKDVFVHITAVQKTGYAESG